MCRYTFRCLVTTTATTTISTNTNVSCLCRQHVYTTALQISMITLVFTLHRCVCILCRFDISATIILKWR